MDRAVLAVALVACGARTDLGGARMDASTEASSVDAAIDVVVRDVTSDAPPSKCPPIDYANDAEGSTVFAIDAGFVYFMSASCVVAREPLAGGPLETWPIETNCAGELVTDGAAVYFTDASGHLLHFATTGPLIIQDLGCAAVAGCPGNVHVRAVTNDFVVLVDGFVPVRMWKTIPGFPGALISKGAAPPAPVHYVFVDDTRAYWNNDIRVLSSLVNPPTQLIQYSAASSGLAIDSSHVFWTVNGGGSFALFRANNDDTGETVISNRDTSTPLVASDAFGYGVSPAGITKQPTSGATPTVIVPNVHPLTLALDDSCVYFTEKTSTGRRISRAPN
jgi:hypothetical protein